MRGEYELSGRLSGICNEECRLASNPQDESIKNAPLGDDPAFALGDECATEAVFALQILQ